MQIVLFRHGIAEDREIFARTGSPDSERPLTGKGEQRTRSAATGLMTVVPRLAAIGSSPYVRAHQTAEIIADVYGDRNVEPVEDLQPGGRPTDIGRWLKRQVPDGWVVCVGHEPDLSCLMAWLTTGETRDYARFKKAGACLIECSSGPSRGAGKLQWLLPPVVLRRLAGEAGDPVQSGV